LLLFVSFLLKRFTAADHVHHHNHERKEKKNEIDEKVMK
jgi:hypothetical protein